MAEIKVGAADPVTAIATAISEIAQVIAIAFSGKNRKMLLDVKRVKRMQKALDIAEEVFRLTDEQFKEDKEYVKLMKKFSKLD